MPNHNQMRAMALRVFREEFGPITPDDVIAQIQASLKDIPESAGAERKAIALQLLREFAQRLEDARLRISQEDVVEAQPEPDSGHQA